MKRKGILLASAAVAVIACGAASREPRLSMHECDWLDGAGVYAPRYFRTPGHLFHHLRELLLLQGWVFRIYLLREMPPSFREQIMIVTAVADECPG